VEVVGRKVYRLNHFKAKHEDVIEILIRRCKLDTKIPKS